MKRNHLTCLILLAIALILAACTPKPATFWDSMPVMPGARNQVEQETSFEYDVHTPLPEVENFYLETLADSGWSYEGLGEGVGGLFMIFHKENGYLEIAATQEQGSDLAHISLSLRSK